MTKYILLFTALLLSVALPGRAGVILIQFDTPDVTLGPGENFTFTGVISNGSADTVYLNNDSINLFGSFFTVSDYFFNVPFTLDPGESTAVEFLNVSLNDPFLDPDGTYAGTYVILGGLDGFGQDVLGSADFSITGNSTPEPASLALATGGLIALAVRRYGRRTLRAKH